MPRIVSYNVRRCLGRDKRVSPARIAEVIAPSQADIVALQELDVRRARTGNVDQAEMVALELGMQMHFHPALRVLEEQYGDAILTAAPSQLVKAGALPSRRGAEPRGALWTELLLAGKNLQLINTHLGLRREERLRQIETLLGPDWIGRALHRGPLVVVGDFNSLPGSKAYGRLSARLRDPGSFPGVGKVPATFPASWPFLRIDHAFAGPGTRITGVHTIRTPLARIASDHLPLVIDFEHEAQ